MLKVVFFFADLDDFCPNFAQRMKAIIFQRARAQPPTGWTLTVINSGLIHYYSMIITDGNMNGVEFNEWNSNGIVIVSISGGVKRVKPID